MKGSYTIPALLPAALAARRLTVDSLGCSSEHMNGWLEIWRFQEKPWAAVWIDRAQEPLKPGDKVKILRWVGDGMTALVEHEIHGTHRVGSGSFELPREFKTARGKWIPESDPRVRVFLEKALADVRAGGKRIEASSDPDLRRRTEQEILRILGRNGWGVE